MTNTERDGSDGLSRQTGTDAEVASGPHTGEDDPAVETSAAPPARKGWKYWATRIGQPVLGVALLVAVVWAVVQQWDEVRDTILGILVPYVIFSAVLAIVGMVCNVMAFNAVLDALGTRIRPLEACRCYLVGQIGKYLPGSVWSFVLQMELAKRAGVPRVNGFTATIVTLGLSTASALAIGLIGLPYLFAVGGIAPWLILGLLPVAAICATPPVLTRLVNLLLKLMRRRSLPQPLGWAHVGRAIGWTSLAWVCFGTHLWFLATSGVDTGFGGWVQSIGVFALAMTAGSLALVAPSGIGIREAIIVAALAPFVPTGVALGLALASRLVFTVADLIAAAGAWLLGAWSDRRAARTAAASPAS